MKHSIKCAIILASGITLLAGCSKQKKPEEIPLNVDQAMELYGVAMNRPAPPDPNQVLITVDGTPITQRELQTEAIKLLRSVDMEKLKPEQVQQVQQQLLARAEQTLVQQKVLLNAVKNSDVKVAPEKIEEYIASVKKSLPEGTSFEQFLADRQLTEEHMRTSIEAELKVGLLLQAQVDQPAEPDPAALRTFYSENPDQFNIPDQVAARHILVKLGEKATGQEFIEKKAKIRELHKRLLAGEKFETLIAVESEDSSPDGSLGVLRQGSTLPAIEEAVFALQPGEFTEPIKTEHGFHIVQVQQKFPAKIISFEEAMPQIAAFLKQQAQKKVVADFVGGLMKEAKVERATAAKAP